MKAYPFLWGKSEKFVGWECIAKPEFLSSLEGPARRVLEEAQAGIRLDSDQVRLVRGTDPRYGILDIAYRRVPSHYKESGGRSFDFIEGVLLRDRDNSLEFSHKHFDAAWAAVQPQYEKFIEAERWTEQESLHNTTIDVVTFPNETKLKVLEANSTRLLPITVKAAATADPVSEIPFIPKAERRSGPPAPPDFLEQKIAQLKADKSTPYSSKPAGSQISGPRSFIDPASSNTASSGNTGIKLLAILAATVGALMLLKMLIDAVRDKK